MYSKYVNIYYYDCLMKCMILFVYRLPANATYVWAGEDTYRIFVTPSKKPATEDVLEQPLSTQKSIMPSAQLQTPLRNTTRGGGSSNKHALQGSVAATPVSSVSEQFSTPRRKIPLQDISNTVSNKVSGDGIADIDQRLETIREKGDQQRLHTRAASDIIPSKGSAISDNSEVFCPLCGYKIIMDNTTNTNNNRNGNVVTLSETITSHLLQVYNTTYFYILSCFK
jgi:hypothetical protein